MQDREQRAWLINMLRDDLCGSFGAPRLVDWHHPEHSNKDCDQEPWSEQPCGINNAVPLDDLDFKSMVIAPIA
jgi:hypothetical protein